MMLPADCVLFLPRRSSRCVIFLLERSTAWSKRVRFNLFAVCCSVLQPGNKPQLQPPRPGRRARPLHGTALHQLHRHTYSLDCLDCFDCCCFSAPPPAADDPPARFQSSPSPSAGCGSGWSWLMVAAHASACCASDSRKGANTWSRKSVSSSRVGLAARQHRTGDSSSGQRQQSVSEGPPAGFIQCTAVTAADKHLKVSCGVPMIPRCPDKTPWWSRFDPQTFFPVTTSPKQASAHLPKRLGAAGAACCTAPEPQTHRDCCCCWRPPAACCCCCCRSPCCFWG